MPFTAAGAGAALVAGSGQEEDSMYPNRNQPPAIAITIVRPVQALGKLREPGEKLTIARGLGLELVATGKAKLTGDESAAAPQPAATNQKGAKA